MYLKEAMDVLLDARRYDLAKQVMEQGAQRQELLEALQECLEKGKRWHPCDPVVVKARAAIAKALGENH